MNIWTVRPHSIHCVWNRVACPWPGCPMLDILSTTLPAHATQCRYRPMALVNNGTIIGEAITKKNINNEGSNIGFTGEGTMDAIHQQRQTSQLNTIIGFFLRKIKQIYS